MPVAIHQCARCELRFRTQAELTDHLDHDHGVPGHLWERLRYTGRHPAEPLYRELLEEQPDAHRVLLVANLALEGPEFEEAVRTLAARGPVTVYVLVPATPSGALVRSWDETMIDSGGLVVLPDPATMDTDDAGVAQARFRLRHALRALAAMQVPADGEVGDPDPVRAVSRLLATRSFDEIVVVTLPSRVSTWLEYDVPTRLRRLSGLPVQTVQMTGQPAALAG